MNNDGTVEAKKKKTKLHIIIAKTKKYISYNSVDVGM